jgi:alpha-D-xyloside xylohydrolase
MKSLMHSRRISTWLLAAFCAGSTLAAQNNSVILERGGSTIVLEPYAPNILRVTLSLKREPALAGPGYGLVAKPSATGWSASQTARADVYRSDRVVVTVDRNLPDGKPPVQTQVDISKYFNGTTPGAHIVFSTPEGKQILEMNDWSQSVPNHKDGTAAVLQDRRPGDPEFYTVGATFASPDDEHYYGLGQSHEGFLDHRGHQVRCWADYLATGGPSFCVPFLVTNKGSAVGQPFADDH